MDNKIITQVTIHHANYKALTRESRADIRDGDIGAILVNWPPFNPETRRTVEDIPLDRFSGYYPVARFELIDDAAPFHPTFEILEYAFSRTNSVDRAWTDRWADNVIAFNGHTAHRSTSVGDVIVIDNGLPQSGRFAVTPIGFSELPRLSSLDTYMIANSRKSGQPVTIKGVTYA